MIGPMVVVAQVNDPTLRQGQLLRSDGSGHVVDLDGAVSYVRRGLSALIEGELSDGALWLAWRAAGLDPSRLDVPGRIA